MWVTLPFSTLLVDTSRLTDHVSQHSYICEFYAMAAVSLSPLFGRDVAQPSLGDWWQDIATHLKEDMAWY
jgi:hypothetical protein